MNRKINRCHYPECKKSQHVALHEMSTEIVDKLKNKSIQIDVPDEFRPKICRTCESKATVNET